MSNRNIEVIIDIKRNDNFSEFGIYKKKKITSILSHESSKNKKIY
jgi:hypothetical protein